ncbi:MAG TPA: hypothetical protein VM198_13305 [Longimicrobiales bacterium]|nr:hypothetical protein [Longimicrobiales bacterium]
MTMRKRFPSSLAASLAALFLVAACGEPAPEARPEASLTPAPSATMADVRGLGVMNASMPIPNVLTAGQPTEEQMAALIELGYTNFVSLRPPTENGAGWEEMRMRELGDVSFSRISVAGAGDLTRENVEALDRILDEAGAENSVVYCASSNRVGGLLALRAFWLDGASPEEALALGREAGLRGLEPAVAELMGQPR